MLDTCTFDADLDTLSLAWTEAARRLLVLEDVLTARRLSLEQAEEAWRLAHDAETTAKDAYFAARAAPGGPDDDGTDYLTGEPRDMLNARSAA